MAEALFRADLAEDLAVEAFDRVFGWAMAKDFGEVEFPAIQIADREVAR